MPLTAAQIKTILDGLTYAETVRIFDFVNADERRKYPSIDINNVGSEIRKQDEHIQQTQQRFECIVYYRIRGSGSNDIANLEAIENVTLAGLEAATLAGSKIIVEDKSWNRISSTTPVHMIKSTLTVFVTDLASQTGSGIFGRDVTVDIGSITDLQIYNENLDAGRESFKRHDDVGDSRDSRLGRTRTWVFEYEYTKTNFDIIEALIVTGARISVTKKEVGETNTIYSKTLPVRQRPSTTYGTVKTVLVECHISE